MHIIICTVAIIWKTLVANLAPSSWARYDVRYRRETMRPKPDWFDSLILSHTSSFYPRWLPFNCWRLENIDGSALRMTKTALKVRSQLNVCPKNMMREWWTNDSRLQRRRVAILSQFQAEASNISAKPTTAGELSITMGAVVTRPEKARVTTGELDVI